MENSENIPHEIVKLSETQEAAKTEMISLLSKGHISSAIHIKDKFNIPAEVLSSSEVQEAAKTRMISCLSGGYIHDAIEIKDKFNVPLEILSSPDVQEVAKTEMIRRLSKGDIDHVIKIKDEFNVSAEVLSSSEVQEAVKQKIGSLLAQSFIDKAVAIKNEFNVSLEIIQETIKQQIIKHLSFAQVDKAIKIRVLFNIPSEIAQEAAKQGMISCLSSGFFSAAVDIKNKFKISSEDLASLEVVEATKMALIGYLSVGNIVEVVDLKNNFNFFPEFLSSLEVKMAAKEGIEERLSEGLIKFAIQINNEFKLGLEKALKKVYDDFGETANYKIFTIYQEMLDGRIPESLEVFKIKQAGESGLNQFKQKLRGLQKELLRGGLDEKLLKNSAIQPWLKSIVGYDESKWGDHDDETFAHTIETYLKNKKDIKPLLPEYEESEILKIDKADHEKQAEFKHAPAFLSRYDIILRSIQEARSLFDKPNDGVIPILERLSNVREYEINRIDEQIFKLQSSAMPEEKKAKAIQGLEKQKETLNSLDLKNIKPGQGPQEIFKILSSFKAFADDLRALIFYASYKMNPEFKKERIKEFSNNNPSLDELSWVMNFTDHITNQETFSKYFSDKESLKMFDGLLNISALQQEMARMQNQNKKGTMSFQFVPTRNLLTEFSGHIADACWASKYESILKEFPNFVSLIMVQNPEKEKEARLAGAALLIEAEAESYDPEETLGEPLLVIRGLNPKENVINQLVVEDFYKKVIDYLKPIAEKRGRKLAIVIDYHSGGAATNRPVLFTYLDGLKEELTKVELMEPSRGGDVSTFNDYDIINDVYLVE